jgi:hypothetical protein
MLHEIILSLSGHPSPLLNNPTSNPTTTLLSPPEKELLSDITHLSDLHCKLLRHSEEISSSSPSSICQAVSTSIKSTHLAQFQRKVLDVESSILRKDSSAVGAYNIVPLTAVVGEFTEWTRRLEWLWEITKFMLQPACTGARIIDRLCAATQTGYSDIESSALQLVRVAETAWLKQVSGWVLYGRLPSFGKEDFFVHQTDIGEYEIIRDFLPEFVNTPTASSILFIGRSLNHIRVKGTKSADSILRLLPAHLQLLSSLSFPISSSSLANSIIAIRKSLSQSALQELLPVSRIQEILALLHEFFLLRRGEFALALINETDEKMRNRWRRSDNLAYEQRNKITDLVIKDGEVSAVLARTWATMAALQGLNDDEDDQLDLARELIDLKITKPNTRTPVKESTSATSQRIRTLYAVPFSSLLLSIPTTLSLKIPSPLDLFLAPLEVETYSTITAYLLSIRRAHIHLSDLWKITSLRRHHPAPPRPPYGSSPAGRAITQKLRSRVQARGKMLRGIWATSSAALFLLGEVESYFHGEIVKGAWEGLQEWLTGSTSTSRPTTASSSKYADTDGGDDIWASVGQEVSASSVKNMHDPQTLSTAHRRYLLCLTHNLLLTTPYFTNPLHQLLQQIDHLVALVHRIHTVWSSLDLENDEGVVDAFSDFRKEEIDVEAELGQVSNSVKNGIASLIRGLRDVDLAVEARDEELRRLEAEMKDVDISGEETYIPKRLGRVDRLLMKLDFGGWFDGPETTGSADISHDEDE